MNASPLSNLKQGSKSKQALTLIPRIQKPKRLSERDTERERERERERENRDQIVTKENLLKGGLCFFTTFIVVWSYK
jgi:hypothetical protein